MNKYQKAMFSAYWFPVVLFYVLPNLVMMCLAWPIKALEVIQYFLLFPLAIFLAGFIFAPIFGPKVNGNKGWSFLMAFICMFIALFMYIFGISAPGIEYFEFNLILVFFLAMLGIFPALLGGLFFIGACKNASTST